MDRFLARTTLVAVCLLAATCGPRRFPWSSEGIHPQKAEISSAVRTLNPGYDRLRSRILVREITRPTRANLDFAAYHANVITLDQAPAEGVSPASSVPGEGELFGGVLQEGSIVAGIGETPLTAEEIGRPLAFSPLVDVLSAWNYDLASPLEDARTAVRSESWGHARNIQVTYQEITTLYRHTSKDGIQWWVEIEFRPWALLFEGMPDSDADGCAEIFGRLRPGMIRPEVNDYLDTVYTAKVLDRSQITAWANELASYWYPSYNTDIVDLGQATSWPSEQAEQQVVSEVEGFVVENPAVVMRGKPTGETLYNVFVVPGLATEAVDTGKEHAVSATDGERRVKSITQPLLQELVSQLQDNGQGSWAAWAAKVGEHHSRLKKILADRPERLKAIEGRDGFLFFRDSIEYVVGGDLREQARGKDPFPAIVDFKDYLESLGVDFLLVPIPTKLEVFPYRLLPGEAGHGKLPILKPTGRKFLCELSQAGVEVVDLLDPFLDARGRRKPGEELLYQHQDTHWTDRGLQLAARLLAERIRRYPWYEQLVEKRTEYRTKKVTFRRHGDLVSRLAEREKKRYRPQELIGNQVVNPDGELYTDDAASPIVILGDSFTGVFQRTYCRHAGVSAHLAKEIGYPVDLVMSYGGGPNVRRKLMRRGEDDLRTKRLVIWMFAARDLYDYWEDWEPLARKSPESGQ